MRDYIRKLITICTLLVLLSISGLSAAELSGHIFHAHTSDPLADVEIILKGTSYKTTTNSEGYFLFKDIPGGIYEINALLANFKIGEVKRYRIGSSQKLSVEIRLRPLTIEDRKEVNKQIFRTGTLTGKIINKKNKTLLPGATIKVSELGIGTSTSPDGSYRLINIKPGRFTIEVSLIGYKQIKSYSIDIYPGETINLDFELEETVLPLGTGIIVYGERPLMDPTTPAAVRTIEFQELERGTVYDMADILKELPGVIEIDNELHIRGGRTYETQYMIDGVPVSDPLIRKGFSHTLNTNSIREINLYSGGADAEFSQATSGVIEIKTREGQQDHKGSVVYKNDHPFGESSFNTDLLEMTLSGPEPLTSKLIKSVGLPGETYFFWSGNFRLSDTHLPYSTNLYSQTLSGSSLAPRSDNHYSAFFKLSWKLSPLVKLAYSYSAAATINQDRSILQTRLRTIDYSYGFPYEYSQILDNYNTFTQKSNQHIFILDYNFTVKKKLRATLSRFFTTLHSDVDGKHWSEYQSPLDDSPQIFEIDPDSSYVTISQGDGFWDSGDGDSWYDHYIENYSMKLGYESELQTNYTIKMGLETEFQTVQVLDIFRPWLGESGFGLNYDAYQAKPSTHGAYIQNKLNLNGMIFDFGLRYDLWFPGKYAEDILANDSISPIGDQLRKQFDEKTTTILGRKGRGIISPRFGIANLVTRDLTLFASYSRFSRKPPPQYLYAKLLTPSQSAYQFFGNPALDFEKNTNIEIGFKYLPNENIALGISGYLKHIQDYIAATSVAPDPRFPNETYFMYFNLDFATSQGVEIEYIHKFSKRFTLSANTAFSKAKGERSLPEDILRNLKTRSEGVIFNDISFDWDKPWQFVIKTNFNSPKDEEFSFLGIPLFDDWNLNIKFWGQAGKRYTPYQTGIDDFGFEIFEPSGEINSKIGPWWNSLDLAFQKYFHLGNYNLTLYFEAINILDHKNVTLINPLTGDVYKDGDTVPNGGNLFELPPLGYQLPLWENPTRFLKPRQLQIGLGVSF